MASGLQDIPLRRIPKEWDRQWFAEFVRDVLRLADSRNIRVGSEFELTGQSDEVATLSMGLGGIDLDKLAQQPALSVIGNPTNATASLQALVAASNLHVLRRSGTAVGFGLIDSSYISDFQEASEDVTAALIDNGTGISWAYNDVTASLVGTVTLAPFSTTNLAEGTNLYYTAARFNTAFAAKTTTDLTEGSNLYYTDVRARAAISVTDTVSVDLTYTGGALSAAVLPAGVNHNALLNYVADQHVAHTGITLTAGAGLTGGGDISASRTFDVGAGTGITVNANDVAVNQATAFAFSGAITFTNATGPHVIQPTAGTGANIFLDGRLGAVNRIRYTTDGGSLSSELRIRDETAGLDKLTISAALFTSAVSASITGNLTLNTAGNKLLIKEGSNASMGVATLVAGTVVVSTNIVTASSRIFLTIQSLGTVAVAKAIAVTARSAGTSFTITSADATDTSVIAWHIVEPG